MKKMSILKKTVIQGIFMLVNIFSLLWSIIKSTNKVIVALLAVSVIVLTWMAFAKKIERPDERDCELLNKAGDYATYSFLFVIVPLIILSFVKPDINFTCAQVCFFVLLDIYIFDFFKKIAFLILEAKN